MAQIEILNPRQLDLMRASCTLASETLTMVGHRLEPGVSTEQINTWVHDYVTERGAYPSPLNYKGFPKSVCTSVNDVICHGIPNEQQVLKDGDIINVDVTTYLPKEKGFHGDTSATFYIGEPSDEAKLVVETSRHCLELGIAEVKHGARMENIGAAIQEYAEAQGCSVVRDFIGHGVGREFHMKPEVKHYGRRGRGRRMKRGWIFTIEPMINLGTHEVDMQADGWTALTLDRRLSAQFEHTILVTDDGAEVLTRRDKALPNSETLPWSDVGPLSAPAAYAQRESA
ncbi:MAG: type I methionyl aminopeptidase [Myxococcota bacterium]